MKFNLKVLIEPNEDGGFTVTVPDLPGCVTQGDTLDEALENAREAIEGHIETLISLGKPIPAFIEVSITREAA